MLAHDCEQMLGLRRRGGIQCEHASLTREGNAFEDSVGGLGTESANLGKSAPPRRFLQLGEIRDLELLMDLVNFLRRESGDLGHVEQAFGSSLWQLIEMARRSGVDEIAKHRERGGSETAHFADVARGKEGRKVIHAEGKNSTRGSHVGASLEAVLAPQLEVGGDL